MHTALRGSYTTNFTNRAPIIGYAYAKPQVENARRMHGESRARAQAAENDTRLAQVTHNHTVLTQRRWVWKKFLQYFHCAKVTNKNLLFRFMFGMDAQLYRQFFIQALPLLPHFNAGTLIVPRGRVAGRAKRDERTHREVAGVVKSIKGSREQAI